MTTKQELIEWADISGISIGRDERSPYPTLEQLAQFAELARAQPPAPEQQAPQGIKLTHVFTPDVDAEQRKLCEKYRDLVQGVEKQDELKNALWSLDFYKARCDLLQKWQSKMRDPERTIVCDILANGQTMPDPTGARYGLPAAPEAAKPETERAHNPLQPYADSYKLMARMAGEKGDDVRAYCYHCMAMDIERNMIPAVVDLLAADSKAGREPVAWETRNRYCTDWVRCSKEHFDEFRLGRAAHGVEVRELYTRPQQQAKPLTEDRKAEMWKRTELRGNQYEMYLQGIEEAERAHGIGDQA